MKPFHLVEHFIMCFSSSPSQRVSYSPYDIYNHLPVKVSGYSISSSTTLWHVSEPGMERADMSIDLCPDACFFLFFFFFFFTLHKQYVTSSSFLIFQIQMYDFVVQVLSDFRVKCSYADIFILDACSQQHSLTDFWCILALKQHNSHFLNHYFNHPHTYTHKTN